MTRRRLWTLTALCCICLAIPSVDWRAIRPLLGSIDWNMLFAKGRAVSLELDWSLIGAVAAIATVLALIGGGWRSHRIDVRARVRRMSRRGHSVPRISLKTGLSQDAVRDLLRSASTFDSVLTATMSRTH